MAAVTFLLPAAGRIPGPLHGMVASALGRADRLADHAPGRRAQLLRHFELGPCGWPMAALTRQADAGDAGEFTWLRADPAWVRPDINGARLFACGDGLHLDQADADALLPALQALFAEAGLHLDAPVSSHWYVRMARDTRLPDFTEPADALGADLFDHLPRDDASGSGARQWRSLLSEAQVLLHNHPWNVHRAASGKPPVNSIWFWGGGRWPDRVISPYASVLSEDSQLRALALAGNASTAPVPIRFELQPGAQLVDLRLPLGDDTLGDGWLVPACAAVRAGRLASLHLDCEDGHGYRLAPRQRWRVWRKPQSRFGPPVTTAHSAGASE